MKEPTPIEPPLQRIRRIEVDGLFGMYHHVVPLKDQRVTVMHGVNGVGKTTLLKMVDWICRGDWPKLDGLPFLGLRMIADEAVLEVSQGPDLLSCSLNGRDLPIRRVSRGLDNSDAVTHLGGLLSPYESYLKALASALAERCQLVPTRFIKTQRLAPIETPEPELPMGYFIEKTREEAVDHCARGVQQRVEETRARYGDVSQALERTFPQRLLISPPPPLSASELVARLKTIESTRQVLEDLGLLADSESNDGNLSAIERITDEQARLLTLYANDSDKKLAAFDDLARRLGRYLASLNQRFRHKKIRLDREAGLAAIADDGRQLPLTALSSGEQHQIVLLYELLFETQPNTLVLIDEPELSLHVTWQAQFLDDMLDIARIADIDILIATHSPDIIGNHHDLLVELKDEVEAAG